MLVTEQSPAVTNPTVVKPGATRAMRPGRVIGCRVDQTTLLIIGLGRVLAGEVVAGDVMVGVDGDQEGTRRAFVSQWRLPARSPSTKHGFAALLPQDGTDNALTAMQFGEEETGARYTFAPRLASAEEAAAILAESAGPQSAAVIDGLVDVLMAGNLSLRRLLTITAFLQAAHANDGFIELIGESHEGTTFLQGWSRGMAPGPCRMSVVGTPSSAASQCAIAVFPRPDAPDGAPGFVGLIEAGLAARPRDIEGLVFRGRAGWRYAAAHPRKRIIGPLETPEHVRSILPRVHGTPDVLLLLRAVANSFAGEETVSSLPFPVRMGIDNMFEADGGKLLASGWLYDPDAHVTAVRLRRRNGAARLDEGWTRLDRPDVTNSFNDQQHFAPSTQGAQHAHGFIAHAQLPSEDHGAPVYFELTLRDSRRAFLPVRPTQLSACLAAWRQIGSIDPASCALPAIVDEQIVPFLSQSRRSALVTDATLDAGCFDQESGTPIVIGVGEGEENISPLLALLALDPETRRAPIVIVMPAERFRRQAARLKELVRFYRLSARLVSANGAGDFYDMLEAGTQGLSCETVVSLSASLVPRAKGWYGKLLATAATLKGSIISPVLAYEDHSIRWAGNWIDNDNGDELFVGRYAGYPLKAVTEMKLTRIAAASLECCVMPRDALLCAGGFAGGYLGVQKKGLDLGLRLSRSGIDSYLLPSVQMWGCDEAREGDSSAMAALVEEIDRKIFTSQWSPALAGEKHRQKRPA
ncbi:hypothetical protein ATY81_01350 [Rhizobium sp. R72]|uniref:hypothetical protein n=1 Tax=unclassified Rhizobium TaxID=2613769 RepID=UPI000B533352|nr:MULTISPECIES: hypothetical protein [unclassified Rhizobium]OWW04659.1 hypothetical protein ATY81_01350 [Rhizobium sp. R72]OWW05716.1 hypothetical protein ATY80_01350 [Rhizobium sp. R711]